LCESGHCGLLMVPRLILRRGQVADRLKQSAMVKPMVKPIDPVERGEFDGLAISPRPFPTNHLVLKRPMIDSAIALS
jgi:hypothetical protein